MRNWQRWIQSPLSESIPTIRSAWAVLSQTLLNETPETVLFTVNALQELGPEALVPALPALQEVLDKNENNYVNRAVRFALETIESL